MAGKLCAKITSCHCAIFIGVMQHSSCTKRVPLESSWCPLQNDTKCGAIEAMRTYIRENKKIHQKKKQKALKDGLPARFLDEIVKFGILDISSRALCW